MAYIVQVPNSPFWYAMWRGPYGQTKRSTRVRVTPRDGTETKKEARERAQKIADSFEKLQREYHLSHPDEL